MLGLLCCGCSTTPTKFDRTIASVETNYTPILVLRTNIITLLQTNVVVVPVTNEVGVILFRTNLIEIPVLQTNLSLATNLEARYVLTPNQTATNIAAIAGAASNLGLPGIGGLVGMLVFGVLSGYLKFRNLQFAGKNDVLSVAAGELTQIIETGSELMAKTSQGQSAANAFKAWMVAHQAETETIGTISQLVKDTVNNEEAKKAADAILALMGTPPKA